MIERVSDLMSGSCSLCVTTPPKSGDHRHCGSGDLFLISHVTSQNHIFKWQVGNFGSFGHYCSRDITFLICQMISQNHVIKGLCNFTSENFSR